MKGFFGYDLLPESASFGLRQGQMRGNPIVERAGWYNQSGERFSWGDLSLKDFANIQRELTDDEIFIVLGARESSNLADSSNETIPDIGYMIACCIYAIKKDGFYRVSDHKNKLGNVVVFGELHFHVLSREEVKALITAMPVAAVPIPS